MWLASCAALAGACLGSARALAEDVEAIEGEDDISRLKRLVRNVSKDVTRLHERLDQQREKSPIAPMDSSSFGGAGGSRVETTIGGTVVIDDERDPSGDPFGQPRVVEETAALDVAVTTTTQGEGNAALKLEFSAPSLRDGSQIELRKVLLESSVLGSDSAKVKISPFGCTAADLIVALHPLHNLGLSRLTRKGCTFLHACQGALLSASWTSGSLGLSALKTFNVSPPSESSSLRLSYSGATQTVGQALVRVSDFLVLCASSKITSTYEGLDIESGGAAAAVKRLGYCHDFEHCVSAASTFGGKVLLSGWATANHQGRVGEWWCGATTLGAQRNGWGLSLASDGGETGQQVEAFVKQTISGVDLTPGLVYLPATGRKILSLGISCQI